MPKKELAKLSKLLLLPGDRFLKPKETAEILGTTDATLNFWRVVGRGPKFYRHNRSVRYLLSDVTVWATKNCVEPERATA
jgi:hypothetical protein